MRLLFISILVFVASCTGSTVEETEVSEMFSQYQSALLRDDGSEAVQYLSERTVDYYSELVVNARSMPKGILRNQSLLNRLAVLKVRSEFDMNDLASLTGTTLLEYAIEKSWINKEGTALYEVKRVRVKDDFAAIRMTKDGEDFPFAFEAYRESGEWKLDLTSIWSVANSAFVQQVKESGMTEDAFIDQILRALGHAEGLSDDLWMASEQRTLN